MCEQINLVASGVRANMNLKLPLLCGAVGTMRTEEGLNKV